MQGQQTRFWDEDLPLAPTQILVLGTLTAGVQHCKDEMGESFEWLSLPSIIHGEVRSARRLLAQ